MRGFPALVISTVMVCVFAADAAAQSNLKDMAARVPVASVPSAVFTDVDCDGPAAAAKRLADQFYARLQPIERRVSEDERLRRASEAVGLSAVALGALRGGTSLTFVGTQALRLGFDRQLRQIRNRTGFTVEPSIGYRSLGITASRPLF